MQYRPKEGSKPHIAAARLTEETTNACASGRGRNEPPSMAPVRGRDGRSCDSDAGLGERRSASSLRSTSAGVCWTAANILERALPRSFWRTKAARMISGSGPVLLGEARTSQERRRHLRPGGRDARVNIADFDSTAGAEICCTGLRRRDPPDQPRRHRIPGFARSFHSGHVVGPVHDRRLRLGAERLAQSPRGRPTAFAPHQLQTGQGLAGQSFSYPERRIGGQPCGKNRVGVECLRQTQQQGSRSGYSTISTITAGSWAASIMIGWRSRRHAIDPASFEAMFAGLALKSSSQRVSIRDQGPSSGPK